MRTLDLRVVAICHKPGSAFVEFAPQHSSHQPGGIGSIRLPCSALSWLRDLAVGRVVTLGIDSIDRRPVPESRPCR